MEFKMIITYFKSEDNSEVENETIFLDYETWKGMQEKIQYGGEEGFRLALSNFKDINGAEKSINLDKVQGVVFPVA